MKRFIQYITEVAESSSVKSDDKGKMHELLLAKHLHPETRLPEHHRAYSDNPNHSGTPQQVHDKLKAKMSPAAYDEIDRHAKQSAEEFKKSFPHKITNVHWTSNADTENTAGDHEKTTGVKDVNSNADLILTHSKGFHGISAKYGSGKVNYKNPGIADIESRSGAPTGSIKAEMDAHNANMEKLGYTGSRKARHEQWKDDAINNPTRYNAAMDSVKTARTNAAMIHAHAMSKKSDSELRDYIRAHTAAKTHIPHTLVHSKVNKKTGSATPVIYDPHEHIEHHLSKFSNLTARSSGQVSYIYGTHKDTGKEKRVSQLVFKGTSGPHKGEAGMFNL
jgi:hypothetical protein